VYGGQVYGGDLKTAKKLCKIRERWVGFAGLRSRPVPVQPGEKDSFVRIVIQRVSQASVEVEGRIVGAIGRGYLLLVGISDRDDASVLEAMAQKVVNLRLFPDPDGDSHFHCSVLEEQAELLVVSQFTLYANCRKGRRPSFSEAGEPSRAERLCADFVEMLQRQGVRVETGRFGASMRVSLVNEGPVTIWLDSDEALARRGRGES
jgi:D-tyrosyl-tRNA(Tyr) deacylase